MEIVYHDIHDIPKGHWPGSDPEGIRLWAANIPIGSPDGPLSSDPSRASSRASSPPPMRTPKLLRSNLRPAAASLCMSIPHSTFPQPSRPLVTPQQSIASLSLAKSLGEVGSLSMSSLHSGITDSVIATPSSTSVADPICSKSHVPQMLDALAIHVRSWVSPLAQPQNKFAPSPRASRPAAFTLNNFTQSHMGLRGECDDSGSDDYLVHDVWWASEGSVGKKKNSAVKRKASQLPRSRHPACAQENLCDDHPAYHARGRKTSRAFA
jgi:hypothetical protein